MIIAALLMFAAQEDLTVLKPEDQPRKMLYKYLEAECAKKFEERRKVVAALKTPGDIERRQKELRAKFIQALGGFPERTPLNPRVVGTVKGEGFRVEKVVYESRPDHHVTGALYIPEGQGPFPGVLVPCGHSDKGKAEEAYQRISILLAKNGFVVLCYDPIGQGERMQILDASGKPIIKGTTEHTMIDVAALLVGWSTASFRIWDGIRSIDYLASRPEVDPKRLGCTGNSGGGTMTAYLMALDDRIACAAPSCYVTTLERLFATIGPQDGEQNITGQVAFGMEQTDYVTMRAPKPTLICTATHDFFDIQGSWTTFREAKQLYGILGHAERVDLIEYPDKHGFSKPRREAATRWMRRWLRGVDDAVVEADFPVFKEQDLWCTASGQVLVDLKGKSAMDLIAEQASGLEKGRSAASVDEVRRRTAFEVAAWDTKGVGLLRPSNPYVQAVAAVWRTASGLVMSGVTQTGPNRRDNPIVVLSSQGRTRSVQAWASKGENPLVLVDLPGLGETAPDEKPGPFGKDWKEAFLALHLGSSLMSLRVQCARELVKSDVDILAGEGETALIALHVAAMEPKVKATVLDGMVVSWMSVAKASGSKGQLASATPGVLKSYDLPDLAAMIAPRPLTIRNSVDPMGKPVSQEELEKVYAKAREAYKAAGAEKNLVLQAAP